jgi:sugar lactone lactonase YvrE
VLGHDFPDTWTVLTPSTCTVKGSEERICLRTGCVDRAVTGTQTRDIDLAPNNHTLNNLVNIRIPNTTLNGLQTGTCTNCGAAGQRETQWQVSTLAGSTEGFANGQGAAAQFDVPHGVAVDSAGNVYVADSNNHRIRMVSPTGLVTTLAGSGTVGFLNAQGTAARFNLPRYVAVDSAGNVYVADMSNHRIRMISSTGNVTTLAGSDTAGFLDEQGAVARFSSPNGVAVDSAGNVYVADANTNRIRKISPAGVVTTLAGGSTAEFADGQGEAARFNQPTGVAVDSAGNSYVADRGNSCIRMITSAGVVTTLAGGVGMHGFVDGQGAAARFNGLQDIAVDSAGNIYVADMNNHRIRKMVIVPVE